MAIVTQKQRGAALLDARQATESAFKCFRSLFPKLAVSQVTLEEVEASEDGKYWMVTLGFNQSRSSDPLLPDFLRVPMRKLKVFKVNATTGRVLSMKIPKDE